MVWVIENGQHIGTIANCFRSFERAENFVKVLIEQSPYKYIRITRDFWLCIDKNEAIQITSLP
jgi:hypothetical protein